MVAVVKDGYLAASWGKQGKVADILSSAKPILSTLLFFAIQEGKIPGVDARVADFGWDLRPKATRPFCRANGCCS